MSSCKAAVQKKEVEIMLKLVTLERVKVDKRSGN